MEKGTLVEFSVQGGTSTHGSRIRLGVVDRPQGKKNWVVIDAQGQSHTLHPRQISYSISDQTYTPADIPQFLTTMEEEYDPASLELAWELLAEEGQAVSPADLAQLLFSAQSAPLCYAAHRLLSEDKLYFKLKGDRYEPRSAAQVAELKHQIEKAAQRQQAHQQFQDHLRRALAGEAVTWQASDRVYLTTLEKLALFGQEATNRTQAIDILAKLGRPTTPESAFRLLVDLGLWQAHENLWLRRSQIPVDFPEPVLATLQPILATPPPDRDAPRRDLTHLKVFTIDDETTTEIDDGLSLEDVANGQQRLWIHIADPSRWLSPGAPLDLEARRRGSTLYLPTGMIPMFPEPLATGPMSLVQGQSCCALSFGIILTAEGAVASYEICPSHICPTYCLSYADVDQILDLALAAEPEILAMAQWAERRRVWRQTQGAININLPEKMIKVQDDVVQIEVLNDSLARDLVAEMMILTGEVAAHYGEAHGIPLPFRSQPQPDLPPAEALEQMQSDWVRAAAMRRCMPRSEVSTTPARHASLGLDRYCQVTSPIRRYGDLLAHFQLKAHLRGEPLPWEAKALGAITASAMVSAQEASQVERQTNRYWSLEYLRQQGNQVWQAIILRWLREPDRLALVLLEDLGLELPMRIDRPITLGDRFSVRARTVDPRLDRIKLEEWMPSAQ